ncbi:hypothetical protein EVAR_34838_1 [Eumeta japonica]|uniref:Uncharacterized protein n=1 Tax=Eumeta variegata TaxID=151549 RepID=A0A4C1YXM6_EUMVA|nr:hypothetical protein EVAR_34838_1 [Eumeta japonica]
MQETAAPAARVRRPSVVVWQLILLISPPFEVLAKERHKEQSPTDIEQRMTSHNSVPLLKARPIESLNFQDLNGSIDFDDLHG